MITAPESNIKFTDEQTASIKEAENRLFNLESLISIANKNLKITKTELERNMKDNISQKEILESLQTQISDCEIKKNTIIENHNTALSSFHETIKKNLEIADIHKNKEIEFTERENILSQRELEHNKKVEDFKNESNQLLKEKLAVKTAKEAFLKANESITW